MVLVFCLRAWNFVDPVVVFDVCHGANHIEGDAPNSREVAGLVALSDAIDRSLLPWMASISSLVCEFLLVLGSVRE